MPRRFIVLTLLAAGTAIAVAAALATPALAKGSTQASIAGPGLARPVTVSASDGEALPGQGDTLSSLAEQTGLFTVLFGPDIAVTPDQPSPLRTPPQRPPSGLSTPSPTRCPASPPHQARRTGRSASTCTRARPAAR